MNKIHCMRIFRRIGDLQTYAMWHVGKYLRWNGEVYEPCPLVDATFTTPIGAREVFNWMKKHHPTILVETVTFVEVVTKELGVIK